VRRGAFAVVTATLVVFLFGASAPTPLYVVYEARFRFSATTPTAIFAVYALVLLLTLIPAGAISDAIGRRPVIFVALALQALSMAIFLLASGTRCPVRRSDRAGRGDGNGDRGAERGAHRPPAARQHARATHRERRATRRTGAGSGRLRRVVSDPVRATSPRVLGAACAARSRLARDLALRARDGDRAPSPNGARAHRGAASSPSGVCGDQPRTGCDPGLAGLYLSLGPSLAAVLLHSRSHIVGGLVPAALCSTTAIASQITRAWPGRRALLWGTALLSAGVLVTFAGIRSASAVLLFGGSLVAGLGFSPAFSGSIRTLAPHAPPDARAGLVAAFYLVSYLAFSGPAVLAGLAGTRWGLRDTASVYAIAIVAFAVTAGALTFRQRPPAAVKASAT
jgi:MFS family permease